MSLPKSKRRSSHRPWWAFLTGIMPRRALLGCCMLGAGTVAAASFEPPRQVHVGHEPYIVAAADFNGDGKADLVVADDYSSSVSVLLGKGDGTFADAQRFDGGGQAYSVTAADVNGDGRPDIIVSNNEDYSVTVLLGNGDGTFQAPRVIPTTNTPVFAVVADVNGDGHPDIVTADGDDDSVSILVGDGTGNFAQSASSPIAIGYTTFSLAVGEINGDGRPEIITANENGDNLTILVSDGAGGFAPAANSPVAVGHVPYSVVLADVNRDGRLDLVVANYKPGSISVLLGDGAGGFTGAAGSPIDTGNYPNTVAVADVDGDGIPDIVTANDPGSMTVLLGNGDGTYQASQDFAAGAEVYGIAVTDLNGDGRLDLVTTDHVTGCASILLNGTAEFLARRDFDGGGPASSIAAADLNSDGITDLVVTNHFDDAVAVLLGNGDGTFQAPRVSYTYYDGAGYGPESVAATDNNGDALDFNGDGIPDIVTRNYDWDTGSSVTILLGNGDGTFGQGPGKAPIIASLGGDWSEGIAVADMTGDGLPEILTTVNVYDGWSPWGPMYAGYVVVLQLDGAGVLQQLASSSSVDGELADLAVADVDGDGALDVVTIGTYYGGAFANRPPGPGDQSFASVLLGDGEGDLDEIGEYLVGQDPRSVAVQDVNGDGRADIVAASSNDNTVSVLLNTGAGTFAPSLNFSTGLHPEDVTIADMNGDGSPDIVTANWYNNSVSILLGNGHGGFGDHMDFLVGSRPGAVVSGDFNGDDRLDLATANMGSGGPKFARSGEPGGYDNVSVLLSNPPPTITGTVAGQAMADTATLAPFTGVTIADKDIPPEKLIVEVKLDDAAKGTFTTLNGFVDMGGGVYKFTGTPTECTNAIRGLVFTPTPNRVAAGTTETTTFTITANDGILPVTTDSTTTVVVLSVNDAPRLTDPVTASPSPANPGDPVQFSAPFVDPERGAVTYFWDFGDGTTSTDPSPSHTYTVPGLYTATVTVTDAGGGQTTGSVTVQVGNIAALANAKLLVRLDFNRPGHDFIRLTGVVVLPEALSLSGQQFYVNIGGVTKLFTLDKNGKAKSGGDSIQVKPRKTGHPRTALVTVVLARGSFAAQLADEGYTTDPVKGKRVTVNCAVAIGNNLYAVPQPQKYTVKPGPMGFSTNPPR